MCSSTPGNSIGAWSVFSPSRSSCQLLHSLSRGGSCVAHYPLTEQLLGRLGKLEKKGFKVIGVKRDQDDCGTFDFLRLHGFVILKLKNDKTGKETFLRIDWHDKGFTFEECERECDFQTYMQRKKAEVDAEQLTKENAVKVVSAGMVAAQTGAVAKAGCAYWSAKAAGAAAATAAQSASATATAAATASAQAAATAEAATAAANSAFASLSAGTSLWGPAVAEAELAWGIAASQASTAGAEATLLASQSAVAATEAQAAQVAAATAAAEATSALWVLGAVFGVAVVIGGVVACAHYDHAHTDFVNSHKTLEEFGTFLDDFHPEDQELHYDLTTRNCNHVANAIFTFFTNQSSARK